MPLDVWGCPTTVWEKRPRDGCAGLTYRNQISCPDSECWWQPCVNIESHEGKVLIDTHQFPHQVILCQWHVPRVRTIISLRALGWIWRSSQKSKKKHLLYKSYALIQPLPPSKLCFLHLFPWSSWGRQRSLNIPRYVDSWVHNHDADPSLQISKFWLAEWLLPALLGTRYNRERSSSLPSVISFSFFGNFNLHGHTTEEHTVLSFCNIVEFHPSVVPEDCVSVCGTILVLYEVRSKVSHGTSRLQMVLKNVPKDNAAVEEDPGLLSMGESSSSCMAFKVGQRLR